jgi:signal transduction histidine kinase
MGLIATGVVLVLVAAYMARAFTRWILVPLQAASEADRALAVGHEKEALVTEEPLPADEIGDFIRQRNANVRALFDHERKLLMEQKRRAEAAAALEGISYSMVHDMRAPLRAVSSYGDLLGEEASERLTEMDQSYLQRMKKAVIRMDHLICDLLKYSSLLHADVALSPIDVTEIARQVVAENPALKAFAANIKIQESMPLVRGNSALLRQSLAVLLDNARKYTRVGIPPRVNVWAEVKASSVRIYIEDNGSGMSREFQERLFRIFEKGTNAPDGTGIGLALVRVAMERMDGSVGVESEQGKGSKFWIELKPAP